MITPSTRGEELSPSQANLGRLSTISPIEISYQPARKDRKAIMHDINLITRRRRFSNERR
jgi:hypothetical protein